jgi:hypothetical protein
MYTKLCSVVAKEPNVCPNVGWVTDFNEGQAMIDVPSNGGAITGSPPNNPNWPQLNNSRINLRRVPADQADSLMPTHPQSTLRFEARVA